MKTKHKTINPISIAIIIVTALIVFGSCKKTYRCEVTNQNVNAEPSIVYFTGTKDEMKAYEEKGTFTNSTITLVTKCK